MQKTQNTKAEVKIIVGHKIDGTPIRKSFYGKSKREAKQRAEDYLIEHGRDAEPAAWVTLKDVYDQYYTERTKFIRDSSVKQFENVSTHFLNKFGDAKLKQITKADITHFSDELAERFSQNYTKAIISALSSTFKYAIDLGVISSNPCTGVKFKSKIEKKERHVYTEEEADAILAYTYKNYEGLSVHLMLSYGTTISETLGMKYSDIDFESGTISINQSVTKSRGKVNIDNPKNQHRKRVIAVSRKTLEYIKANHNPDFTYIVNDGINKDLPHDPQKWRWQVYKKFMTAAQAVLQSQDIDINILNPHELRHTRATIWVNNNVNLFAIAEQMGWSDLEMLRKVYGHPDIQKVKGMLGIE